MTLADQPRQIIGKRRYHNAREWVADLGDIPLDRILFEPWPGTATEEDLLHYVEGNGPLCELVDGVLVEKPRGYWEGVIAMSIGFILGAHVRPRALGLISGADSTMRMKAGNIRLPDVGFTASDRAPRNRVKVPLTSPDLAIEVLSKSNTRREITRKMKEYFETGTRLVWIVDPPTRTVAIHTCAEEPDATLTENDTITGGAVLPDFSCVISEFFQGVPRDFAE